MGRDYATTITVFLAVYALVAFIGYELTKHRQSLVIVHESKVVKSELDFEEVTSFVVSVGADFPKSREALELPR